MMMDCPRCGFTQPKDRYCANCGLDVDLRLSRPKPLWLRALQNPNLHLSLIGVLMCTVIFYILFSRSSFVSRGVHKMLGTPIASRDAGEGEPRAAAVVDAEPAPTATEEDAEKDEPPATETAAPEPVAATAPVATEAPKKLELGFFEVSRETLRGLLAGAENAGEGSAGRAFLVRADATKIVEALRGAGARKLGEPRTVNLAAGQQMMVVTPTTTPEPFQFGLSLQITRFENRETALRWDSQIVLGQPESPAKMAAGAPPAHTVSETNLTGSGTLGPQSVLLLVLEPLNRRPRPEFIAKAGDGPWTIFNSEDFRAQLSDWVAVVQAK